METHFQLEFAFSKPIKPVLVAKNFWVRPLQNDLLHFVKSSRAVEGTS